jgi:regulator of sigma E protease
LESIPLLIGLVVLVFFVLIGIHEWGHFHFAKRAGILVREFSIGFGPKLFSFKRGETTFLIKLLPIGGYVMMAGEETEVDELSEGQWVWIALRKADNLVERIYTEQPNLNGNSDYFDMVRGQIVEFDFIDQLRIKLCVEQANELIYNVAPETIIIKKKKTIQIAPRNRHFASKTIGQRALAIFAGPLMNFLLAFLLFMSVVFMIGVPKEPTMIQLDEIVVNSPAEKAGLRANDVILSVNDKQINGDGELISNEIANSPNKPMTWVVKRADQTVTLKVTPKIDVDDKIRVGVVLGYERRTASISEAITGAWDYTIYFSKAILNGFKRLVMGDIKIEELGGPVRTVTVTYEAAQAGFSKLVFWAAILSLYLGIFNLLPFPALDGSRLLFLAIEWVRGKPIESRKENLVHFIGFAAMMGLMLVVTYYDIARFFK